MPPTTDQPRRAPFIRESETDLAIVCSHYDLGVIHTMVDVEIGSRRSRKWILRAQAGDFVLKERPPGGIGMEQLCFGHELQLRLESRQFPVSPLVGTRPGGNSLVEHGDRIYEMTRLVRGSSFNRTPSQAREAGRTLARFHALLADVETSPQVSPVSYHRRSDLAGAVKRLGSAIAAASGDGRAATEAESIAVALLERYAVAVAEVDGLGYTKWPPTLVHGDWHPGNLLFRADDSVAGVFDFDTVRFEPRVVDIANGAVQFSMQITGGGWGSQARCSGPGVPSTISDGLNEPILLSFLAGYDAFDPGLVLAGAEVQALPHLMTEALIAETIPVIAQTGRFGRWDGLAFLRIVEQKVNWIESTGGALIGQAADSG